MKKLVLIICILISYFSYSQETYTVGNTEYYYNQYYSTTGKPVVKRSETNKKKFLRSKGYTEIPHGYQIDHIIPLSEGGSDDPSNMQLLTIEQHKAKTAKERAKKSNSTYSSTKSYYNNNSASNDYYDEPITTANYSRTDTNGRLIYKGTSGGEYYVNSNGNKVYVNNNDSNTYSTPSNNSYSSPSPTSYSSPSYSTPSSSSSTSRNIQTGPRGGQYYINSNGNKTYIKK